MGDRNYVLDIDGASSETLEFTPDAIVRVREGAHVIWGVGVYGEFPPERQALPAQAAGPSE